MTTLNLEFASPHFELVHGTATLIREPQRSQSIAWAIDNAPLVGGLLRRVPYDGIPGRIVVGLRDLRVRRRTDGAEFIVQNLMNVIDLTRADIEAPKVLVRVIEHLVMIIKAVDAEGQPVVGLDVSVLIASPQPMSIGGVTDVKGELIFLARSGFYSVTVGGRQQPAVVVLDHDAGERVMIAHCR